MPAPAPSQRRKRTSVVPARDGHRVRTQLIQRGVHGSEDTARRLRGNRGAGKQHPPLKPVLAANFVPGIGGIHA